MFARPHKISPNCRYGQETDHSFTKIAIPLLEKSKILRSEDDRGLLDTPKTTSTIRTGDSLSYSTSSNDHTRIPRSCARRMYRVVSYREDASGKRIFFDPLDGKVFTIGAGFVNRVSNSVILFETKKGALSERYPYNQIGAAKSGNGHYPRVLIAFDAWGNARRRYGGAPSLCVEYAKAMKLIEFLDPPHPVPKRLCDRYVEPFFYTLADKAEPNRLRSPKHFKINKFFSLEPAGPFFPPSSPKVHSAG